MLNCFAVLVFLFFGLHVFFPFSPTTPFCAFLNNGSLMRERRKGKLFNTVARILELFLLFLPSYLLCLVNNNIIITLLSIILKIVI